MTSRGMEKMKHDTIGVDVSKDHLDAHRLADGATRRFANDRAGHKAPIKWLAETPLNRVVFEPTGPHQRRSLHAYVEQFLVPTLKPGDVVILDNLGSHKGRAVRKAIRDVGARLVFLPKYSPDLNPIEQVFAKFKTLLRKAEAPSYEAISGACGKILAQHPPAECAAYLNNAGYG
jgi:transposase